MRVDHQVQKSRDGHIPDKRLVYDSWTIASMSFVIIFFAYGTRYCFSAFYLPITEEFGWSMAISAMAYSINLLVYGVGVLGVGFLVDRFRPRKMISLGAFLLCSGLLFCSQIQSLWHFYLGFGVILSLGICFLGLVVQSKLLSLWFSNNLGTAMGVAMSGMGMGMMVLVPFIQYLINLMGWRSSFVCLAALMFAFIFPLNLLLNREASPGGATQRFDRDRSSEKINKIKLQVDMLSALEVTLAGALMSYRFWSVFLAFLLSNITFHLILVHQIPFLIQKGFSEMSGATALGTVGLLRAISMFLGGVLSDRLGRGKTYMIGTLIGSIGIILLLTISNSNEQYFVFFCSTLFGLGYGTIAPIFPALAADLFSGKNYGKIYGFITLGMGLGAAIGPWVGGMLYDLMGDYRYAFMLAITSLLASTVCIKVASMGMARGWPND